MSAERRTWAQMTLTGHSCLHCAPTAKGTTPFCSPVLFYSLQKATKPGWGAAAVKFLNPSCFLSLPKSLLLPYPGLAHTQLPEEL